MALSGVAPLGIGDYFRHLRETPSVLNVIALIIYAINLAVLLKVIVDFFYNAEAGIDDKSSDGKICPLMTAGYSRRVICSKQCVFYNDDSTFKHKNEREQCELYKAWRKVKEADKDAT